jgi:MoaA/NifB/PqqE/SkfB family radical SAM enzyme
MDLSVAQRAADELGSCLVRVNLYNWGEPLLHPRIADVIRIFRKRRVFTVLATNLSINNTRILEDICDAGLDYLSVSISGASQTVYEQYHAGGDIQRVPGDLRHIQAYKRALRTIRPVIEIKYLLFKHNLHEVEAAERLTREAGAQIFYTFLAGGPESAILPEETKSDGRV